jgi:NADP-dependent 3-hydroxy acid dehydrogenase YdfG
MDISRVAIVTGATSGIGEATVTKFVSSGFGVIGNARNTGKLRLLEKELGPAFRGVSGDATDGVILDSLFSSARERFGRDADIVVANAGKGLGGAITDADLSRFDEVFKVNVTGTALLLQKAAQRMVTGQQGRFPRQAADIVIIGSVVGRHISPFSAVYGATKFAAHSLAEGLRRELGPKGIRVSLVEPGIVITGFQDAAGYSEEMVQNFHDKFGPLLHAQDVANCIYFIVAQPPHMHVSDLLVRPTRQDYP